MFRAMAAITTNPMTTDANGGDGELPCGLVVRREWGCRVDSARTAAQRTLSDVKAEGISRVDLICVSSTCSSAG